MSNIHLRDRNLSLKAKGLLSMMLSLPEDWDYSVAGLTAIVKEGYDSVIDKAHICFLDDLFLLTTSDRRHGFSEIDEEFIKSSFLSSEFKEEIYLTLKDYDCPDELKELLNGDKDFNDFTKEEIELIMNFNVPEDNREWHEHHLYLIDDYLFVLDGVGVVQYIKEKYGDTLPIEMLTRSNVSSSAFYYSGYGVDYSILGEGHLFSLYRKFVEYYPDKVEEFISLVNSIDLITPTEFVNNYMIFVRNGLNSNFMLKKGNISIEGLDGNKRDALGPISMFSLFDSRESKDAEYSRKLEKDHSDRIKKDFEKMVNDYNESIGSAMVLTIKPNNNGN